jgi:ribose 5-phosphate isomerase A
MGLTPQDRAKQAVGLAAVERYVRPGMLLGLGSGTTSHWFVRALGAAVAAGLEVRGVPTSTSTRVLAESLGIPLVGFDAIDRLELVVDGPDEVDRDGHMIKGGGACLLWERIVADAADYYVVVADTSKLKDRLGAFPLPIEVVQHGWESTTRSIARLLALHGYPADVPLVRRLGDGDAPVVTDSGNFIVDAHLGSIPDPLVIDRELNWIPGVVENGLFTGLADEVIFGDADGTITVMQCGSAPAGRPTTTVHGLRRGQSSTGAPP